MAIDIPIDDPIRLTTTASTDVYVAPTEATVRVVNLRFGLMHDGTSTDAVSVAVHRVSTNGTYGTDTEVDRVSVSAGTKGIASTFRLGPGGKIVCAAGEADQITVNIEDGAIFS